MRPAPPNGASTLNALAAAVSKMASAHAAAGAAAEDGSEGDKAKGPAAHGAPVTAADMVAKYPWIQHALQARALTSAACNCTRGLIAVQ